MKDFMGKEIEVGDTIAYPVRQSSSMWLRKGVVLEVLPSTLLLEVKPTDWDGSELPNAKPKKVVFASIDRCVVVDKCSHSSMDRTPASEA